MADLIEFGKIVNTHGLKGEFKIYSYTNDPDRILSLKKVYINNIQYVVSNIKFNKNMFIAKLKGIDKIEDVQPLMNKMCFREIETGESNENDGYFVKDLIGIEVVDIDGNVLGTLKEVFNTGANDVYEVIDKDNKSIYLPAIVDVVKSIDVKGRKMVVKLMEGL